MIGSFLRALAPHGSRRRQWCRSAFLFFRRDLFPLASPRIRNRPPTPDLANRDAVNAVFGPHGWHIAETPIPPTDAADLTRYIVELLIARSELHHRFPTALRDGGDGPFAKWLTSDEAGVERRWHWAIEAAFARRPGQGVVHVFDQTTYLREVFPLGLTPCERGPFLAWMLQHRAGFLQTPEAVDVGSGEGRPVGRPLTLADISWFLIEYDEDPSRGLTDLYRRQPSWQAAVPDALESGGWPKLKAWIVRHYGVDPSSPWLTTATAPPPASPLRQPGVNVLGHFRYPSGLQTAAVHTVAALERAGFAVDCRDAPAGFAVDRPGRNEYLGLHPYPITISQLAPEPVHADRYEQAGLAMRPGVHRIGYWYWELEQVPAAWSKHARWLHELWAPTRFIGDALRASMSLPVFDMLPGMAMPSELAIPRTRFGLPGDQFLFAFVFDMGSTAARKNPLGVVEAFRKAFGDRGDIGLVLKVARGWQDPTILAALKAVADGRRIHLLDEVLAPEEVHGLIGACDAYVSLHRSEGFGLTLAEAMALGKPTIATRYSGNLDFMSPDNSLLVDFVKTPIAASARVYRKGCVWAEPSTDHAAEWMRWIVAHPGEAKQLGQRASQSIRETLSLDAAAERMRRRLSLIRSTQPPPRE